MYRIVLILIFCLPYVIKAQEYASRWQENTIEIDGDLTDWDERPGLYDSESGLLYAMRNDTSNIYFCFEVKDRFMQNRIIHAGLEIKFVNNARPKTHGVINFQAQANNTIELNENKSMDNDQRGKKNIKQSYMLINPPILSEGFIHSNGVIQPGNSENSAIAFAVDWNSENAMVIELRIPLSALYQCKLADEEKSKTKILLQASVAALSKPGGRPNQGGMSMSGGPGGSRPGGGNGGPPPGGGGGGQKGGMQGGPQDDKNAVQKIKNKFILTVQ